MKESRRGFPTSYRFTIAILRPEIGYLRWEFIKSPKKAAKKPRQVRHTIKSLFCGAALPSTTAQSMARIILPLK